ncbi:hypothetical protein [Humisphaera borealis]|uniref:Uncharacterized protein n=1 Tax=Humisphaera borealis TaxID=2807512 RepID=A0A7M2WXU1_9BACT|nr:hypothetical protein [Humisphaera borealis]QOV90223.1 hypothetical protein IPV69_02290 [Humisphaera borealis]
MTTGQLTISDRPGLVRPETPVRIVPSSAAAVRPVRASIALAALDSVRSVASKPNFLTSVVLAIFSLGVAPALRWSARFRRSADANRRALLELARWGESRTKETEERRLLAAAYRVRFYPSLLTVAMVGIVAAVGAVAWGITQVTPGHDLGSWFIGLTYGALWPRYISVSAETSFVVFGVWSLGLTVAYSAHLLQVHLYAWSLRRFLDEFNKLAIAEGYAPVLLEPIGFGLSPWLLSCAALAMLSGFWAIPFAFAGATDCRLRSRAFGRVNKALAARVRDIIFSKPTFHRPGEGRTPATSRCVTDGCATPLARSARYCPRCGVATGVATMPGRAVRG